MVLFLFFLCYVCVHMYICIVMYTYVHWPVRECVQGRGQHGVFIYSSLNLRQHPLLNLKPKLIISPKHPSIFWYRLLTAPLALDLQIYSMMSRFHMLDVQARYQLRILQSQSKELILDPQLCCPLNVLCKIREKGSIFESQQNLALME